jgi:hypothetical protein
MKNLQFSELTIDWYDLTYEQDKYIIEDMIKKF